jgi:hypothetical protein
VLDGRVTPVGLQRPVSWPRLASAYPQAWSEHMGMRLERQFCGLSSSLDHASEAGGRKWSTALGTEYERRLRLLLALEPTDR